MLLLCKSAGSHHTSNAQQLRPSLTWPNLVCHLQVFLTPTHLGIAMEYAAGGELFDRIVKAGRFSEGEARFFFQQLISGVDNCHSKVSCASLQQFPLPMQWEIHFARTSAAVHFCWLAAHLYEEQNSIGVIAVTPACCEPVLQSTTEQCGMHFAQTSAAVHFCWLPILWMTALCSVLALV
jgi:hypothetical protein